MEDAFRLAETTARRSYGRLLALAASRSGDLAAAEDALAEAFRIALQSWPEKGVPHNPEAWLLTVARRNLSHEIRHRKVKDAGMVTLDLLARETTDESSFPDERLKLLFICAHPAIDPDIRTPLMLQTIMGLDASRIASAFLTSPAAMGQRLVRAKDKIRRAGIPFDTPEPRELPERLDCVLEAIYALYGTGWNDIAGADSSYQSLSEEAMGLARLIAELMPQEPEPKGLLALILHCEARCAARLSPQGDFIPLSAQETALWSRPLIVEAERILREASALQRMGRFQIEAAIQSLHVQQRLSEPEKALDGMLVILYEALAAACPTIGVLTSRAAAIAEARGPLEGLVLLAELPEERIRSYQPYWALKAHLLQRAGRHEEAGVAYGRAIGLTENPAIRAFLLRKMKEAS